MNNYDILLAHDRIAWLDREARDIQRRTLATSHTAKSASANPMQPEARASYAASTTATPRIDSIGHA